MLNLQTVEYMEQMNTSIGDKERMISWIVGEKVLDCGYGSGILTQSLINKGYDAYGIDLSSLSHKQMKEKGLGDKFIHGNLLDMSHCFEEEFDTIIFSSVLHEVFSYTGFNYGSIDTVLEGAMKMLKKGGRIIIRDGVISSFVGKRIIRFKNREDVLFLMEFVRRFKGRNIPIYEQIDNCTYAMRSNDAMEFLYTYTWGWESFDREVQEQYGVFSLNQYMNLAKRIGGKVVFSEEYLQEGYHLHLKDKIKFYDKEMNSIDLPNSNMLLVIEK